jgi:ATP-dependent 26S proteasome regulatory subunit
MESDRFFATEACRLPSRMNAGAKQRFNSMDVAEPRNAVLIHQKGLYGAPGTGKQLVQAHRCKR